MERGRWVVAITGVAAALHHQRRGPKNRYRARVGVDLGVKTLAVVADEHGRVLHTWAGVKALQHAQAALKLANQSYSRTKRDSAGRKKAAVRLGKMHARVAHLRDNMLHGITRELACGYTSVTIEDLNVAGMLQLRALARHVSDAAFGAFRAQLEYKAPWYGTQVVVAGRWFPSSKTCSRCGTINANLKLSDRVYGCGTCGLVIDRDANAAVNLATTESPATTGGRLTRVPRLHPDEPGQEPTATSLHEGALGRNQHKTTRKVGRRLEGNQEPPPRRGGWSREAGES